MHHFEGFCGKPSISCVCSSSRYIVAKMKTQHHLTNMTAVLQHAEIDRADRLIAAHERFPFISDSALDFIAVLDLEGNRVYATRSSSHAPEHVRPPSGIEPVGIVDPEGREKLRQVVRETIRSGVGQRMEYRVLIPDGDARSAECYTNVLWDEQGRLSKVIVVSHDNTERRQVEEQLRALSRAVEQSPASIIITDVKGNIEYVNPRFCELTGYSSDEVVGQNPRVLKSGEMPPEGYKQMWETISRGDEWRGEFHNRKKNGEFYWEFASISGIRDAAGKVTHYLAVKEDVTERKRIEVERIKLVTELQQALASVKTLSGLLPICAWCKKVRDDEGYWKQIESYIEAHSDAEFTHGICPECAEKHRRVTVKPAAKSSP